MYERSLLIDILISWFHFAGPERDDLLAFYCHFLLKPSGKWTFSVYLLRW